MIDQWIIKETEQKLQKHNRLVILDPDLWSKFLIPLIEEKGFIVIKTNPSLLEKWQTVQEELLLRVDIEEQFPEKNVIIYATRSQKKLSFLFDYCFTHGIIDLSDPGDWLRKNIKKTTQIQTQWEDKHLLLAGKLSVGKDTTWWKQTLQDRSRLIQLKDHILSLLSNPEEYMNALDTDIRKLVEERIFELIGQLPIEKPPSVLVREMMYKIFDHVIHNTMNPEIQELYQLCMDSNQCKNQVTEHAASYEIPKKINIWVTSPNHCFLSLDKQILEEIIHHLHEKEYIQEKLPYLKKRMELMPKNLFIPRWWKDVYLLLTFDAISISSAKSLKDVIKLYCSHYQLLDRAMRHLYQHLLSQKSIIQPLQEYYESISGNIMQKWMDYSKEFETNQNGLLIDLFKESSEPTAVIVGDGLRYEIADYVAVKLEHTCQVKKEIILADVPTETEHDMTLLYTGKDEPIEEKAEREKILKAMTDLEIEMIDLEKVDSIEQPVHAVISYKDIDKIGESLQMNSLPFFQEMEEALIKSIRKLLEKGYHSVYLVTDHGFVLTGLLSDADKITPSLTGKKEVNERYIRTAEKQKNPDLLEFKRKKNEFEYVYVAKHFRPFKTPGKYGYAHGGFTPQEVICPKFCFTRSTHSVARLGVEITNKTELKNITGQHFSVAIKTKEANTLYASDRQVIIILYEGKTERSRSNIIVCKPGESYRFEFSLEGHKQLQLSLLDAETYEHIDSVEIKQSNARDLGGLL